MSLDLTLTTRKPIIRKGTGVFIREKGETRELQTIEEVRAHFPDSDISGIEVREYETNAIFDENITHNLGRMAENIYGDNYSLYTLLWRPEEKGFTKVNKCYIENISECLAYMLIHRKELEQYNPENGWGNYEGLLRFVTKLAYALSEWDGEEEITIEADR